MNEYQLTNDYRRLANPKTRYENILYQGKFELGGERSPESLFLYGEKQSTQAVKIASNDSLQKYRNAIILGLYLAGIPITVFLLVAFGFVFAFIFVLGLLGFELAKCGEGVVQGGFYPEAHRHGALRKLLEKDAELVLHQEGERGFCYQLELETMLSKMDRYADHPKTITIATSITVGAKFILSYFLPKRQWKLSGSEFRVFHLRNFYLQGGQIYCAHRKTTNVLDEWDTIWDLLPKQVTQ